MSRSHNKHKVVKIGKNGFAKTFARKKTRLNDDIGNFSDYKRHFDSWDICDGRWYVTKKDAGTIWAEPKWFRK